MWLCLCLDSLFLQGLLVAFAPQQSLHMGALMCSFPMSDRILVIANNSLRRYAPTLVASSAPVRLAPPTVIASQVVALNPPEWNGVKLALAPVTRAEVEAISEATTYERATRLSPTDSNPTQRTDLLFPLALPAQITSVFGWRNHPVSGNRARQRAWRGDPDR